MEVFEALRHLEAGVELKQLSRRLREAAAQLPEEGGAREARDGAPRGGLHHFRCDTLRCLLRVPELRLKTDSGHRRDLSSAQEGTGREEDCWALL